MPVLKTPSTLRVVVGAGSTGSAAGGFDGVSSFPLKIRWLLKSKLPSCSRAGPVSGLTGLGAMFLRGGDTSNLDGRFTVGLVRTPCPTTAAALLGCPRSSEARISTNTRSAGTNNQVRLSPDLYILVPSFPL